MVGMASCFRRCEWECEWERLVVIVLELGSMDIILVSRNIIVDCLGVLAAVHDPTMVGSDSQRMEWVVMMMTAVMTVVMMVS